LGFPDLLVEDLEMLGIALLDGVGKLIAKTVLGSNGLTNERWLFAMSETMIPIDLSALHKGWW
jgi:hypothetical protein